MHKDTKVVGFGVATFIIHFGTQKGDYGDGRAAYRQTTKGHVYLYLWMEGGFNRFLGDNMLVVMHFACAG